MAAVLDAPALDVPEFGAPEIDPPRRLELIPSC
jgi:hypothetical protein